MATVLRVRRKRSSDPSEALIFSCKKARTAGESSGKGSGGAAGASGGGAASSVDVKTVFKFAGTVAKKDQPISQRIQAALSTVHLYANLEPPKPKPQPKAPSPTSSSTSSSSSSKKTKKSKSKSKSKQDTKAKSRASQLAAQQESRFQIVSTIRGVNLTGLDGKSAPSSVTNGVSRSKVSSAKDANSDLFSLFDVVLEDESKSSSSSTRQSSKPDAITCNSVQMIREKLVIDDSPDSEYVYDLYYADDNQLDFGQSVVTGMQLEDEELVHNFFDEEQHEVYDDEDDSNDENNWRNDYPDEDPDKRHEDLFDEYHDEYRYASSDDDLLNDYGDYRKRPTKNLDYFGGRDPLDDLM